MKLRTLCLAGVCGLGLAVGTAFAQDSTYQQWSGYETSPETDELVKNLEKLIDQAERDRAADPAFLDDLRGVLADYTNPWQDRLLSDDFRDGEYLRNPAWTVVSGQFKVDRKGNYTGLRSTIIPPGYYTGQTQGGGANDLAAAILGTLLNQPATTQQSAQYAAIYTPVKVSNSFAVRLEFASGERFGRFDFGPYQGPSGTTAYRVAYLPGQKDSLRLLRITPKGTVAVGVYKGVLNLEDGRRHVIEWTRDRAGKMIVSLDGQDVITANDKTILKPFDGFLMINGGGSYWVRSITIDGTKA
jgi:hypothetical protein